MRQREIASLLVKKCDPTLLEKLKERDVKQLYKATMDYKGRPRYEAYAKYDKDTIRDWEQATGRIVFPNTYGVGACLVITVRIPARVIEHLRGKDFTYEQITLIYRDFLRHLTGEEFCSELPNFADWVENWTYLEDYKLEE